MLEAHSGPSESQYKNKALAQHIFRQVVVAQYVLHRTGSQNQPRNSLSFYIMIHYFQINMGQHSFYNISESILIIDKTMSSQF